MTINDNGNTNVLPLKGYDDGLAKSMAGQAGSTISTSVTGLYGGGTWPIGPVAAGSVRPVASPDKLLEAAALLTDAQLKQFGIDVARLYLDRSKRG